MLRRIRRLCLLLLKDPQSFALKLCDKTASFLPDKVFLLIKFRILMGYWMDFSNPKTYNEKLQWLKINYKNPDYTLLVDKVEVKNYVASLVGNQYVVPTIGVWDSVKSIDWAQLPNRFVLKTAGDSGGVVICRDKASFDVESACHHLMARFGVDYSKTTKEYPYSKVPFRILAEEYLEGLDDGDLKDYKFFCFNGEPKFLFVASGRQSGDTRFDFFDTDFNHLPVTNGHPNADVTPAKPCNFDEMLRISSILSAGIPHVRVDLYNVAGRVYFGELTFFHWSGSVPFEPNEWDTYFGSLLELPCHDSNMLS